MRKVARDFLISFLPSKARLAFRPESTQRVVALATWGGLAQLACFSLLLWLRYRSFMLGRLKEWAPYLTGTAGQIQGTAVLVSTLEFLIYPVSLLLVYFAVEGFARFVTGLIGAEVLPSLPVSLAFGLIERRRQRLEARRLASLPGDTVQFLAEGRVRIASAQSRPGWNSGITIGIRGEFYEIENKEPGMPGRPFVFVLRPAPAGKALRSYEEYDLDSAAILGQKEPAPGASADH